MTQAVKNSIIRKALMEDKDKLFSLIDALADYEKLSRPDKDARERLKRDLFGGVPRAYPLLAEYEEKAVGYAIYLFTYSSFLAVPTLYIEDVFILPEYRSLGLGKAVFKHLAKLALENDCGRVDFQVLDWNKLAIDFYEKIGAKHLKEWLLYRMTEDQLKDFISKS